MQTRPYILAENTWKTVKNTPYDVAVLPWGATEAHGLHLPYGTDNIQCDHIAAEAARVAWERGTRPVVLPTVPFGVNTGQLDIKLDINMNPSTQAAILHDIIDVLSRQNIGKLVILNGHGGNDFKQMLRELQPKFPKVFLCTVNWWQVVPEKPIFGQATDHSGRMETSSMLAIAPEVVRMQDAGEGRQHQFTVRALRERWAWAQREWSKASDDTGMGSPGPADPKTGRKYLDMLTKEIGDFLYELASTPVEKLYSRD